MSIQFAYNNYIGYITFNNPPYNYLEKPDFSTETDLYSFFKKEDLKAVIVQGGGRHFCAGASQEDFINSFPLRGKSGMGARTIDAERRGPMPKRLLDIIRYAPVPVIAKLCGSCLGAGLEIALACHFRIASKSALLGFPESTQGLIPGMGGSVSLREVVSHSCSTELILTGRLINGDEALAIGLIDKVSHTHDLDRTVLAFIESLVQKHPAKLVHTIMTALNNASLLTRDQALQRETEMFCDLVRERI